MSLPEVNGLSEREQDILRLVATGAGNKQIAAQLFISTNTVKVHLRNIFAKIGVTSRTEAAMTAIRLGLVPSSAVEATKDTEIQGNYQSPGDSSSLTILSSSLASDDIGGSPQPELAEALPGDASPRWGRLRFWLLGAGLIALVTMVVLGLSLVRPQTATPQVTSTPALRITQLPRWQARTSMLSPRKGLAVAAYDGQLYAIGGESSNGITGAVERYDPDTNTWESLLAKPEPVADIQAVVIGGKIYVPGGRTPAGVPAKTLDIFDPGSNQWEQGADLPTALSAYALSVFEGRLYLFGGWDGSQEMNLAYAYDPRTDSWSALTSMPTRRAYAGAAQAGGKIYVIGGKNAQTGLAVVEVYSPAREGQENPWHSAADMPAGRYGMGISSVADIIYVVCGQGSDGTPQSSLYYMPQTDIWQTFEAPPSNLGNGLVLAASGAYLYAVGGSAGTSPLGDILAYQVVYTVGIPVIIK